MLVYIKFLYGMAFIGFLMGFIVPTLISEDNTLLVVIGFCILFLGIPMFVYAYWKDNWDALRKYITSKRGNND